MSNVSRNANPELYQKMIEDAINQQLATLPAEKRCLVEECAVKIRSTIQSYGDLGFLALSLVGATLASKGMK